MEQARNRGNSDLRKGLKRLMALNYVLIALVVALLGFAMYLYFGHVMGPTPGGSTTTIKGGLASFGSTIANINKPFNSTELSIINNAPNSYYDIAGGMLLNGTLRNFVFDTPVNSINGSATTTLPFIVNGKPSVIYIGALSCIYCGENRWAMALALSRFGSFGSLYYGYTAFGDGDLPTIYWSTYNYTTSAGVAYGNGYSSGYVNFISADYESPITSGFQMGPLSYIVGSAPNATYLSAMKFMNNTARFQGTPFTLWGKVLDNGADAVVVGNSMPTNNTLAMTYMTHPQVLQQLNGFSDQFAYSEYAAADVYAAFVCSGISNAAPFCSLPVMPRLESLLGLS